MAYHIDLATVLLLQKSSYIIGIVAFLYLKFITGCREGLGFLVFGFACMAFGSTLAGYGEWGIVRAEFWQRGSLVCGLSGYLSIWLGLRAVSSRRVVGRQGWLLSLPPLLLPFDIASDNGMRAGLFNGAAALAYLGAAACFLRDWPAERFASRIVLALICAGAGSLSLLVATGFLMPSAAIVDPLDMFFVIILLNFGLVMFVVILFADRSGERLLELANTDALTGLFNRRFFFQSLGAQTLRGDSVLLIDIDHFKSINDRFGHAVGDAVLQQVSARIAASVRRQDMLARYGGEEFIVFLPGANAAQAIEIGERIRRAVCGLPVTVGAESVAVTLSAGVATGEAATSSLELLAKLADEGLYLAKREGRNCVRPSLSPAVAAI